jgi:E3 ubiquitin-protein ligase BRE1
MLQRFDSEISDENEQTTEEETTTAFLTQLSSWDPEEMSEQLQQRVDASTRAIMKVVQAFDRIVQRNSKISSALNGEESLESAVKATNIELTNENKNLHILTTALHKQLRELQLQYNESTAENERLEKKNEELQDNCWDFEVKLNRLRHREEQLEKNLEKANERIIVLENQLETGGTSEGSPKDGVASTSTSVKKTTKGNFGRMDSTGKMDELQEKLEDQEKLAGTRLDELTELNTKYKEALMEIEKLKMQLQCLPSEVVTETAEYKCLQSHFSVLYNETMQLKAQLEETKNQLQTSKNNHLRQIEHMESEELSMQRRLRTEVIQLEDNLAQVRREHEMLKLEYEQMVAANEQTAPINREMRNLITSLQSHNSQLKTEVNRQKKKFKDCCHEINKLRQELSHYSHVKQSSSSTPSVTASNVPLMTSNVETQPSLVSSDAPQSFSASVSPVKSESATKIETQAIKTEPTESTVVTTPAESGSDTQSSMDAVSVTSVKKEVPEDVAVSASAASNLDDRKAYNDLKAQMSQLSRKHETLKSMYETSQKQVSSLKKQLSAKNQTEATNLSTDIKPTTSGGSAVVPSKTDKPLTLEEYAALNNKLKEKLRGLEKALQQQKLAQQQHEDALLSEMEVTGNAYENMQETNVRLVQQLREKDAANFKLMSDMIKSQQIQKLLKEEKECLTDQVVALNAQVSCFIGLFIMVD